MVLAFRLARLEWNKVRRVRAVWTIIGFFWLLGILPVIFAYNGLATPLSGLPSGIVDVFASGLLFTGPMISGILGAVLADIDAETGTRLLVITSGLSRIISLAAKWAIATLSAAGILCGQLLLDIMAAEANAMFAFHRFFAIVLPSWASVVSIFGLIVAFLWIGFAARSVSRSLLVGVGVPLIILFGERYLGPHTAVLLGWLPNFSLSNALAADPSRWPTFGPWIPLLVWMAAALVMTTVAWMSDIDPR